MNPLENPSAESSPESTGSSPEKPASIRANVDSLMRRIGSFDREKWMTEKDGKEVWDGEKIRSARDGGLQQLREAKITEATVTENGKEVTKHQIEDGFDFSVSQLYDDVLAGRERLAILSMEKSLETEKDPNVRSQIEFEISAATERLALREAMTRSLQMYAEMADRYEILRSAAIVNGLSIDPVIDEKVSLQMLQIETASSQRIATEAKAVPLRDKGSALQSEYRELSSEYANADTTQERRLQISERVKKLESEFNAIIEQLTPLEQRAYELDTQLNELLSLGTDRYATTPPLIRGMSKLLGDEYATLFSGNKSLAEIASRLTDMRRVGKDSEGLSEKLAEGKSNFDTTEERGRENIETLLSIQDELGRFQIEIAKLSSLRHHYAHTYEYAQVDGKPWADRTSEEQLRSYDDYFREEMNQSVSDLSSHLDAVENEVLNLETAEGGHSFVANVSRRIARLRTMSSKNSSGMVLDSHFRSVQLNVERNMYEALGWPMNEDGLPLPWSQLSDAVKAKIESKQQSVEEKVEEFKASEEFANIKRSVAAVRKLEELQRDDIRWKPSQLQPAYGYRAPSEGLTAANLESQSPCIDAVNACYQQLSADWEAYQKSYGEVLLHMHEALDISARLNVAEFDADQVQQKRELTNEDYKNFTLLGLATAPRFLPFALKATTFAARNVPAAALTGARILSGTSVYAQAPRIARPVTWAEHSAQLGRSSTLQSLSKLRQASKLQHAMHWGGVLTEGAMTYMHYLDAQEKRETGQKAVDLMIAEMDGNLDAMNFVKPDPDKPVYKSKDGKITVDLTDAAFISANAAEARMLTSAATMVSIGLMGAKAFAGPPGWILIGVQITIEQGINIWESASHYDFVENAPHWLLMKLGTENTIGTDSWSVLDEKWHDYVFQDKNETVRKKGMLSYMGAFLRSQRPDLLVMLNQHLGGPEEVNEFYAKDFNDVFLPALKTSLLTSRFLRADFPADNIDTLMTDMEGIFQMDRRAMDDAMENAAQITLQHLTEKRYMALRKEYDDLRASGEENDTLKYTVFRLGNQRMFGKTLREAYEDLQKNNGQTRHQLLTNRMYLTLKNAKGNSWNAKQFNEYENFSHRKVTKSGRVLTFGGPNWHKTASENANTDGWSELMPSSREFRFPLSGIHGVREDPRFERYLSSSSELYAMPDNFIPDVHAMPSPFNIHVIGENFTEGAMLENSYEKMQERGKALVQKRNELRKKYSNPEDEIPADVQYDFDKQIQEYLYDYMLYEEEVLAYNERVHAAREVTEKTVRQWNRRVTEYDPRLTETFFGNEDGPLVFTSHPGKAPKSDDWGAIRKRSLYESGGLAKEFIDEMMQIPSQLGDSDLSWDKVRSIEMQHNVPFSGYDQAHIIVFVYDDTLVRCAYAVDERRRDPVLIGSPVVKRLYNVKIPDINKAKFEDYVEAKKVHEDHELYIAKYKEQVGLIREEQEKNYTPPGVEEALAQLERQTGSDNKWIRVDVPGSDVFRISRLGTSILIQRMSFDPSGKVSLAEIKTSKSRVPSIIENPDDADWTEDPHKTSDTNRLGENAVIAAAAEGDRDPMLAIAQIAAFFPQGTGENSIFIEGGFADKVLQMYNQIPGSSDPSDHTTSEWSFLDTLRRSIQHAGGLDTREKQAAVLSEIHEHHTYKASSEVTAQYIHFPKMDLSLPEASKVAESIRGTVDAIDRTMHNVSLAYDETAQSVRIEFSTRQDVFERKMWSEALRRQAESRGIKLSTSVDEKGGTSLVLPVAFGPNASAEANLSVIANIVSELETGTMGTTLSDDEFTRQYVDAMTPLLADLGADTKVVSLVRSSFEKASPYTPVSFNAAPKSLALDAGGNLVLEGKILMRGWAALAESEPVYALDMLASAEVPEGMENSQEFTSFQEKIRQRILVIDSLFGPKSSGFRRQALPQQSVETSQDPNQPNPEGIAQPKVDYQSQLGAFGANGGIYDIPPASSVKVNGQEVGVGSKVMIGESEFFRGQKDLWISGFFGGKATITIDGRDYFLER